MYVKCGAPPRDMGEFCVEPAEAMYYLYLPIKLPGTAVVIPDRLQRYRMMIGAAIADQSCSIRDKHIYVTAKTMHVDAMSPGNRPGWHIDGFGSDGDLNYIWADMNPTEFAVQEFKNISADDQQSMIDIEHQIDPDKIRVWPSDTLLRLDETVVHRVAPNAKAGFRSFLKITVSDHQFRNAGNSHNYGLDYQWVMNPRKSERNLDHG